MNENLKNYPICVEHCDIVVLFLRNLTDAASTANRDTDNESASRPRGKERAGGG
jgi:hypothetical protein